MFTTLYSGVEAREVAIKVEATIELLLMERIVSMVNADGKTATLGSEKIV